MASDGFLCFSIAPAALELGRAHDAQSLLVMLVMLLVSFGDFFTFSFQY